MALYDKTNNRKHSWLNNIAFHKYQQQAGIKAKLNPLMLIGNQKHQ